MAPMGSSDASLHMSHGQLLRYRRADIAAIHTRLSLLESPRYQPIYPVSSGHAINVGNRSVIATVPGKISTFAVGMLGTIGSFTGRLIPILSGLNPMWVGVGTLVVAGAVAYGAYRFARSIFGF